MGYGQKPDGGGWTWQSATLLPAGARDVAFVWADAQTTTDASLQSLGTRREVAFGGGHGPRRELGPAVTSVSWTDAAGTRHTERGEVAGSDDEVRVGVGPLGLAAQDAELVALGVEQRRPAALAACAGPGAWSRRGRAAARPPRRACGRSG